jgi:hypothetical protein
LLSEYSPTQGAESEVCLDGRPTTPTMRRPANSSCGSGYVISKRIGSAFDIPATQATFAELLANSHKSTENGALAGCGSAL